MPVSIKSCNVRNYILGSILFYPITLEGHRGTTDELATTPLHLALFSAALVELAKSIPVRSLILFWVGGVQKSVL